MKTISTRFSLHNVRNIYLPGRLVGIFTHVLSEYSNVRPCNGSRRVPLPQKVRVGLAAGCSLIESRYALFVIAEDEGRIRVMSGSQNRVDTPLEVTVGFLDVLPVVS